MIKLMAGILFMTSLSHAFSDSIEKTAGRKPANGQGLKIKKSKVWQYDISSQNIQIKSDKNKKIEKFRISVIPTLDLGEEPKLTFKSQTLEMAGRKPASENPSVKKMMSPGGPDLAKILKGGVLPAKLVTVADFKKSLVPDVSPLKEIHEPKFKNSEVQLKDVSVFKPAEVRLLEGLVYRDEQKNLPVALGLFTEVLNDKEFGLEAQYQLGMTAEAMDLHSEFRYFLTKAMMSSDKKKSELALKSLAENLNGFDREFTEKMDDFVTKSKVDRSSLHTYFLLKAKRLWGSKDLTEALNATEEVQSDSPHFAEAQLLRSLILYKAGQLDEAIHILKDHYAALEKSDDADVKNLAYLTMARFHFQKGEYQEAFKHYLKVEKNNAQWLAGLVEQAWSQILAKDYEGAAGNMFSLHTDFFKNAFNPESYVIRTVAYLNLCQYGDALQVLKNMKGTYTPIQNRIAVYKQAHLKEAQYYETVKSWLMKPEQKEVDGLPRRFLIELARHPKFLSYQKDINRIEDEVGKVNQISKDLVTYERNLIQKIGEAQNKVAELKLKLEKAKMEDQKVPLRQSLSYQEKRLASYRISQEYAKLARNNLKDLRGQSLSRLEKEKLVSLSKAATVLKDRYVGLEKELTGFMDQVDVLAYEIFSGAGEHIRYQMGGGELSDRKPSALKPEDQKSMKWGFKGEIWEDEVGHYRSSLQNVCPKDEVSKAY